MKKISQFDQITTRNNDDWLLIEEASTGAYKSIKSSSFLAGLSSNNSSSKWSVVSSTSANLAANSQIVADVSGNSITLNLPPSASIGDSARISLWSSSTNTNFLTINASSGQTINNLYNTLFLTTKNTEITLIYTATNKWQALGTIQTSLTAFQCRFVIPAITTLSDGDLISSVVDLSGNNFTCTASGAIRPTYKTNVIGGKAAALFSGTQYLDLANQLILPVSGDFIAFSVVRPVGTGTLWGGGGDSSSTWGIRQETGNSYAVAGSNLVTGDHVDLSTNNNHVICWGRINNIWRVSKNDGTTVSGGANSGSLRGASGSFIRRLILGAMYFDGVTQSFYSGYLAEFSIKLNASVADINTIGSYYSGLYGIPWTNVS